MKFTLPKNLERWYIKKLIKSERMHRRTKVPLIDMLHHASGWELRLATFTPDQAEHIKQRFAEQQRLLRESLPLEDVNNPVYSQCEKIISITHARSVAMATYEPENIIDKGFRFVRKLRGIDEWGPQVTYRDILR